MKVFPFSSTSSPDDVTGSSINIIYMCVVWARGNMGACVVLEITVLCTGFSLTSVLVYVVHGGGGVGVGGGTAWLRGS